MSGGVIAQWEDTALWRSARVYGQDAQSMIVCLSEQYPEKDRPAFELEVGKGASAKRTEGYLLPLVIGDARPAIVGLPATVGHISLQDRSIDEVAELAQQKIETLPAIVVESLEEEESEEENQVKVAPDTLF